ncbi:MAG: hypothetical protein AB7G88_06585 [Thermomicrobiales bacterium]
MKLTRRGYRPVTTSARPPEPAGSYPVWLRIGAAFLLLTISAVAALSGRSASPLTWYVSRASGMTLYLLLWLAVMLGLGITTKRFDRLAGRAIIYSLHTFVTQLAYGFLTLHLLALVADTHVPFSVRDLVVPFSSSSREPWTGLGVIAAWLFVIIAVSGFARRWISFSVWRGIHMLSFFLYGTALAHGIGAGTDTREPWAAGLYMVTGLSVLALTLFRVARLRRRWETAPMPKTAPVFDRFSPTVGDVSK